MCPLCKQPAHEQLNAELIFLREQVTQLSTRVKAEVENASNMYVRALRAEEAIQGYIRRLREAAA